MKNKTDLVVVDKDKFLNNLFPQLKGEEVNVTDLVMAQAGATDVIESLNKLSTPFPTAVRELLPKEVTNLSLKSGLNLDEPSYNYGFWEFRDQILKKVEV